MQAVEHFITQFVPEHYDLFLDLSRETKTFSGKVAITGQAQSDRISLHQKDLEIASVEVAGQARPFTVDHDNEALHIELAEAGQVEVVLDFPASPCTEIAPILNLKNTKYQNQLN